MTWCARSGLCDDAPLPDLPGLPGNPSCPSLPAAIRQWLCGVFERPRRCNQTNQSAGRPDCFAELILQSQAIAKKHKLPFLLTEFNNGLGGTNRDDASGTNARSQSVSEAVQRKDLCTAPCVCVSTCSYITTQHVSLCSGAAFLFRNVGLLASLDMWSFWTFSDVFEEGWMRSAPFHNGFGMMTVTGTRKVIFAMACCGMLVVGLSDQHRLRP